MKRDLSYLSTCPIAVLGGGAVGKATAADCKLAGREVRLYSKAKNQLHVLIRLEFCLMVFNEIFMVLNVPVVYFLILLVPI